MAAAAVLQTLGADGGATLRAAAGAPLTPRPGLLLVGARFRGGPRRAVQRHRAAASALPGKTFGQPPHRGASHLFRRRPPAAFLGRHGSAPSTAAPAGTDRNPA